MEENEPKTQLMGKVERVVSVGLKLTGLEVVTVKRLQGLNNNPGFVRAAEFVDGEAGAQAVMAKLRNYTSP